MKVIPFLFYYLKLLFGVMLGIQQSANPLTIKWRWSFWQDRHDARRRRRYL